MVLRTGRPEKQKRGGSRQDRAGVERLARFAIDCLRRINDRGPAAAELLQKRTDLEALRDHPEFRKLLDELKTSK